MSRRRRRSTQRLPKPAWRRLGSAVPLRSGPPAAGHGRHFFPLASSSWRRASGAEEDVFSIERPFGSPASGRSSDRWGMTPARTHAHRASLTTGAPPQRCISPVTAPTDAALFSFESVSSWPTTASASSTPSSTADREAVPSGCRALAAVQDRIERLRRLNPFHRPPPPKERIPQASSPPPRERPSHGVTKDCSAFSISPVKGCSEAVNASSHLQPLRRLECTTQTALRPAAREGHELKAPRDTRHPPRMRTMSLVEIKKMYSMLSDDILCGAVDSDVHPGLP